MINTQKGLFSFPKFNVMLMRKIAAYEAIYGPEEKKYFTKKSKTSEKIKHIKINVNRNDTNIRMGPGI